MSRSFLFIFAHPDDESFSGAGTVMKYAAAGVRSVLVTATRGERGSTGDPSLCTPEDLGARREAELRQVIGIVGFDELHLLGYRDRELPKAPPQDVRRKLVSIVRQVRPSVVFTFDPNGFNIHPDHVAISRFASDAIAAAADPRWYGDAGEAHTVSRLLWTPSIAPWEAATRERPEDLPGVDFALDVSAWRDRRAAALRAHRTQHKSIDRCFFNQPHVDRILDAEHWRQAWGPALRARPVGEIE